MNTQDSAYFCPTCNSPAVNFSALDGGEAVCRTCGWHGGNNELLLHSFSHDLGTSAEVLGVFMNDFKNLLAKHAASPLAQFLLKWGFFIGEPTPKALGRYLMVLANAAALALLKERSRQVERVPLDD